MIARSHGVIVNFSSGWGRSTSPEVAPYCATKWAIEGLTRALAQELPRGMAAVPLNPGIIDTDMLRACFGSAASGYPDPKEWAESAVPLESSLAGILSNTLAWKSLLSCCVSVSDSPVARTYSIAGEPGLVPVLIDGLEKGFLDILGREFSDLTPFLTENFDFDNVSKKYHLQKNTKFKCHIPVEVRIKYFLTSYLTRMEKEGKYPTFDEIVFYLMPLLQNGSTPENQTILSVLAEIGEKQENGWKLKRGGQIEFDF
jgi:hypothetical protein